MWDKEREGDRGGGKGVEERGRGYRGRAGRGGEDMGGRERDYSAGECASRLPLNTCLPPNSIFALHPVDCGFDLSALRIKWSEKKGGDHCKGVDSELLITICSDANRSRPQENPCRLP